MFDTKPKSAHRYRICGTPVRTGCITCKIRRVKCGEEKPFCKRCTSTGRKCDGYAPVSTTNSRKPAAPRSFPLDVTDDAMEEQMLDVFTTTTAPKLSGNFCGDFWERRVRASTSEPSIRHGVIAIAAIHQDYISKHENYGTKQDPAVRAFAFRQYTKAIRYLHQLMSTLRTGELNLTLMSCILFICFDCFSGNHDRAIIHLKAGFKILEDIRKRNRQTGLIAPANSSHEWEREFAPIILALGVHAASFCNQRNSKDRSALWTIMKDARFRTHPTVFHSINEARHALDTYIVDIMCDRTSSAASPLLSTSYGEEHQRQAESMETWKKALDRYFAASTALQSPTIKTVNGATVLKVHWLVMCIIINLPATSEERFRNIVSLCSSLVPAGLDGTYVVADINFSTDIGIIAPLFFTAVKAPTISLRRQALDLLSRSPRLEGMWNSDDAVTISSQAIIEAEEFGDSAVEDLFCTPTDEKTWNDISAQSQGRFTSPSTQAQQPAVESTFSYEHLFYHPNSTGPAHAFASHHLPIDPQLMG